MGLVQVPATRRGRERREMILVAAAGLVATRGFHAVGVTEIGAAAGVSGPALYRHFTNKSEILVALLDKVVDDLLSMARAVVQSEPGIPASAEDTLRTLIAAHSDFALAEKSILAIYAQELHNLPSPDRRRLRAKQRRYVDIWVEAYRRLQPAIPEITARVRVEAVFGLLNSVPNISADIGAEVVGKELRQLAEVVLLRQPESDSGC
jgi:AcrR family transcriptional regulator